MERRSPGLRRAVIAQPGLFDDASVGARAAPAPGGTERTGSPLRGDRRLDDVIVGLWEDLSGQGAVPCPLCAGAITPAGGRGSVTGRCGACGTEALAVAEPAHDGG